VSPIDTSYLSRCIAALEKALSMLQDYPTESVEYELYRSACIKESEIILEQSGKLLKKVIKPYFPSSKAADRLYFKDIFRHAAMHSLITVEESERWLHYRDNRNNTAHDYGATFAEETLKLLPQFIQDAQALEQVISGHD